METALKEVFEIDLKEEVSEEQKNVTNLIIESFENMDVMGVERLLDEDVVDEKYLRLAGIKEIFEKFRAKGDTQLIHKTGVCTDCYPGSITHNFTGNVSGHHTSFIIRENNGVVCKLFMCFFHYKKVDGKLTPDPNGFVNPYY